MHALNFIVLYAICHAAASGLPGPSDFLAQEMCGNLYFFHMLAGIYATKKQSSVYLNLMHVVYPR